MADDETPDLDPEPGPYTPTDLPDTPVGVFGCTVRQVAALARNVEIRDHPTGDRDPDLTITTTEVETWIGQLSDALTSRLTSFTRVKPGTTRTAILTAGADAVANAAASYAEAAAHPEYATPADATSYAATLWARWQDAAQQLEATLAALIADAGPDITPDPRTAPAWHFPPPALPDDTRW